MVTVKKFVSHPIFMAVGLTELIYLLVFTVPFPLIYLFNTIPPVDYAKLTNRSLMGMVALIGGLGVLFVLYVWLIKLPSPPITPYAGVICALTLLFSYPVFAIDLFVYAILTRGWALYGLNPLAASPEIMPTTDPWLGLAGEWADRASPYGPVWEVLSLGAFKISGGSFLGHLVALKLLAIGGYVLCIVLIGAILAEVKPAWKQQGMIAFAWNPLVLLEVAQNGHNDIVMVAAMLGAVLALVKGRDKWVILLLAVSVLIKFVTILITPFFIMALILKRRTWLEGIEALLLYSFLFGGVIILGMLPLWPGLDKWALLDVGGAGRSVMALTVLVLRDWLGLNTAFSASRLLLHGVWGMILLRVFWVKRYDLGLLNTILYLSWAALFWYVLLVAPTFHAWYILWFLPLGILMGLESRAFQASFVFSITGLMVIPYFETIRVWYPVLLQNHLLGHLVGVPLLVGPPIWYWFIKNT